MQAGDRFSRCLLDQKNEETKRARRLRRRTILIAILIQAFILTLLMLRPLLGAQAVPMVAHLVPLPPWKGGGAHSPAPHRPSPLRPLHVEIRPVLPLFLPAHRPAVHDEGDVTPDVGSNADGFVGDGSLGYPGGLIPLEGAAGPFRPIAPPPPREEEAPRRPRAVAPEIQQALLITRVEPQYPPLAKQIHLEGTVEIRAVIARDGTVQSLEILSGHVLLARAARDAILQWRYRPTLLRGEPIAVETLITVTFKIQ
jgi:periplasmic protein TonB